MEDIVTENGDLGRAINYLKIDVEGSELLAIPQWLETPEILENIDQIQIEIHTQVQAGVFHIHSEGNLLRGIDNKTMATPEMIFADFGRTYFNLDFSAFHISALA